MTKRQPNSWPNPPFQRFLLIWCLLLVVAAETLVSRYGWQAGFLPAQSASNVLPPWLWESLTTLGDERVLLALMLPFSLRNPRAFWALVLASLLAALLVRGLKLAIPMPRPAEVLDITKITVIGAWRTGHSFPSSHAAGAFASAVIWVAYLGGYRALPILALAGLASFSRIAVGVHWPIDIIAGALVGSISAGVGVALSYRLSWGMKSKVHCTLICLSALALVTLPFDGQGYPGSLAFRCIACAIGLIAFWHDYLACWLKLGWTRTNPPIRDIHLEKF